MNAVDIWPIPARPFRHPNPRMIVDTLSPVSNQRSLMQQQGLPMRQLPTHQMVCALQVA